MAKVTVVIPNYNHARFLVQRIESVLNQTYQDFEILYLDDASTDNSAEIFEPYAQNPRIRSILNTRNTGTPFAQWNRGVREAKTEYVWLAEADDYADVTLLERLVAKLEAHPNVGLAYCQSVRVDENGVLGDSLYGLTADLHPTRWREDFINSGRDECASYLAYKCTMPNASAVVFRKSVYEQAGYADETMRLGGDWMMWVKMTLLTDVAFVADTLNYFRHHARSVRNRTKMAINIREIYHIRRFLFEHADVTETTRAAVLHHMENLWRHHALFDEERFTWKENYAIYQVARHVDPRLKGRFAKILMTDLMIRLRLRAAGGTASRLAESAPKQG